MEVTYYFLGVLLCTSDSIVPHVGDSIGIGNEYYTVEEVVLRPMEKTVTVFME